MFHRFNDSIDGVELPQKFTYPFNYVPSKVCKIAAEQVKRYLSGIKEWQVELSQGKMFGVLVVKNVDGELGFLAAFSGNLAHKNSHEFFVPAVYDLLNPSGFFVAEERNIVAINLRIEQIKKSAEYVANKSRLDAFLLDSKQQLQASKQNLLRLKELRDAERAKGVSAERERELIRESQFQKAEYKRLERMLQEHESALREELVKFENQVVALKKERKQRSANLQMALFNEFKMLNAKGEVMGLPEIFADTPQGVPPAGAGECAAPKLLQYAFLHNMQPISMAEFWCGASPKGEVRKDGCFYPACKSKCEPILKFMLQGLDVDPNPLLAEKNRKIELLYSDEWLAVVSKPEGLLSVPGKLDADSVYAQVKALFPDAYGPIVVHRLDMATSGVMIVAKSGEVAAALQRMFERREVYKRYVAWLDGDIPNDEGELDLPLCPDIENRPMQMVNYEYGKPAHTHFKVAERRDGRTKLNLYPHTGRTHQLRVHAAHSLGLNTPIVGDSLYGTSADRLYLHAEMIEFRHPISGKNICVEVPANF